jgi:hypothetical protein
MSANRLVPVALSLFWCLLPAAPLAARQLTSPQAAAVEALRVFLDCNAFCDTDHLRREITYVNWMRDRQDADIHLLITSQGTGGGGEEYTIKYLGLQAFQGSDDELSFTTQQAETRKKFGGS